LAPNTTTATATTPPRSGSSSSSTLRSAMAATRCPTEHAPPKRTVCGLPNDPPHDQCDRPHVHARARRYVHADVHSAGPRSFQKRGACVTYRLVQAGFRSKKESFSGCAAALSPGDSCTFEGEPTRPRSPGGRGAAGGQSTCVVVVFQSRSFLQQKLSTL
jgi:hypothetical protein